MGEISDSFRTSEVGTMTETISARISPRAKANILLHIDDKRISLSQYIIDCICKVDCGTIPEHRTEDEINDLIDEFFLLEDASQEFSKMFDSKNEENQKLSDQIRLKEDKCNDLQKSLNSAFSFLKKTGAKFEFKDGLFVVLPDQPKKVEVDKPKAKVKAKPKQITREEKSQAKEVVKKTKTNFSDNKVRAYYFEKADKVLPLAKTLLTKESSLKNVAKRVKIYKGIFDYQSKTREIKIGDDLMEEQLLQLGELIKQLKEKEA